MDAKKQRLFHRVNFAGFDNSLLDLWAVFFFFFLIGQDVSSFSFPDEKSPPTLPLCRLLLKEKWRHGSDGSIKALERSPARPRLRQRWVDLRQARPPSASLFSFRLTRGPEVA